MTVEIALRVLSQSPRSGAVYTSFQSLDRRSQSTGHQPTYSRSVRPFTSTHFQIDACSISSEQPQMAARCQAQHAQRARVHGSEGFQRSRSLPGSLYSPSFFLGAIRPPETEHKQYSHHHLILWSRCASVSTIHHLPSYPGEIVTKVVGRFISHTNRCPSSSHSTRLAF